MTTLKTLLDANVISPGVGVITLLYKDRTTVANLIDDGTIDWGGQFFTSLSTFSLRCKQWITHRLSGATTLKTDNGWMSVRYNGEPLSDIRSRFEKSPDTSDPKIFQMKGELNDLADEIEILQLRLKLLELQLESTENAEHPEPPVPEKCDADKEVEHEEEALDEEPIVVGSIWNWSDKDGTLSSVTVNKIHTRDDGSHRVSLTLKPLNGDKKSRSRTICNSKVNMDRESYGVLGYTQEASCKCLHCYTSYMGRQWSDHVRNNLKTALLTGNNYEKYEPLLGASRDAVISHLMTGLKNRYPNHEHLNFSDAQKSFQIDEIIPRAKFQRGVDVNKVDKWTHVFNYRNLQLLTSNDNGQKGDRVQRSEDWYAFYNTISSEGARRVIIDSRLTWIETRVKKGLDLLEIEEEFYEIYKLYLS